MTESTYGERLLERARDIVNESVAGGDVGEGSRTLANALVAADEDVSARVDAAGNEADREGFARSLMSLLLDNDGQPPSLQLTREELEPPICLLAAFFLASSDVQTEANRVLRLIEDKFGGGRFSQAVLLLQLFETDAATQRRNERNLWYEEMVQSFLGSRAGSLSRGDLDTIRDAADAAAGGDGDAALACSGLLDTLLDVRLHVRCHRPGEVIAWRAATEGMPTAPRRAVLSVAPSARWRPLHDTGAAPTSSLQQHFERMGVRDYAIRVTRAVYFHIVSPGRNGFEPLILEYMRWLERTFDVVPTRLMPDLHGQMVSEVRGINEALSLLWETHLVGRERVATEFGADALVDATGAAFARIRDMDLEGLCEGEYDFGGLVFDHLFELQHASSEHAFRLHRLT